MIPNDTKAFYASASAIKSWYYSAERKCSQRFNELARFADSVHSSKLSDLGRALRRQVVIPSVHQETGLLKRVSKAGFGHYIVSKPERPSPSDISSLLLRQEYLMCKKHKRVNLDANRMIRASVILKNHLFGSRKFHPISNQLSSENLNFPASAGYPYFMSKSKVKEKLLADSFSVSPSQWSRFPTMRGLRLQLRIKNNSGYFKPRLIYPYPGVITLLELKYVNPVLKYFTAVLSPYVTGKIGRDIGGAILKFGSNYRYNYSTDIVSFDQNMPNELVFAAFAILRSAFSLTKEQALEFEELQTYFVSAPMCGRVGKNGRSKMSIKKSGIPSGTGFTNLIGSICHLLILVYSDLDFLSKNFTMVCGDDNLFFSNECYSIADLTNIYKPWGLELNLDDIDIFTSVDKIYFLGYYWLRGTRVIDVKMSLNRLVYHTSYLRHLSAFEREVARASSILLNGKNGVSVFSKLFPDLQDVLDGKSDYMVCYLPGSVPPSNRAAILSRQLRFVKVSLREQLSTGWYSR